jgi:hypothetical protein
MTEPRRSARLNPPARMAATFTADDPTPKVPANQRF